MPKELFQLENNIRDIKWLLKLRAMDFSSKLSEIVLKCPCCVARISRSLWCFSDEELKLKLASYEEKLTEGINIDDVYEH